MRFFLAPAILCLATVLAQTPKKVDWRTATELPDVDLSGLTAVQKKEALKQLRSLQCLCPCGLKLAECRVDDRQCADSRTLAPIVVNAVREGKNPEQAVNNSDFVARRAGSPNTLERPVPLPIQGAPAKGPANARITMVEFSDFECPYCSKSAAKVDSILQAYPNDIRLVYKQFPIPTHKNARLAAEASLAAHAQGKFWAMHDKLFANHASLSAAKIDQLAQSIGIDMARFQADLKTGRFRAAMDKDIADGNKVYIAGTPTFFINGKRYNGVLELAIVKPILEAELKPKK